MSFDKILIELVEKGLFSRKLVMSFVVISLFLYLVSNLVPVVTSSPDPWVRSVAFALILGLVMCIVAGGISLLTMLWLF